tara:strand:- start:12351 stop:12725 length:375 start_codon:yes stop_codon:yes gene_type:complete
MIRESLNLDDGDIVVKIERAQYTVAWKLKSFLEQIGDMYGRDLEVLSDGTFSGHTRTNINGEIGDTEGKRLMYRELLEKELAGLLDIVKIGVYPGEKMWWTFEVTVDTYDQYIQRQDDYLVDQK